MKKTLIAGVAGQHGSYFGKFVLEMGYGVHRNNRRPSLVNTASVDHANEDKDLDNAQFKLYYGDAADTFSLNRLLSEVVPAQADTLLRGTTGAREMHDRVPEITVKEICAEIMAEHHKFARRKAPFKAQGPDLLVCSEG